MLEVIYVVRHAARLNWSVDPQTGKYYSTLASSSPTGHPADPVLSSHGVDQSRELAQHLLDIDPPIDVVYSSPWYRCLQTIKPATDELFANGEAGGKIKVEPGLGEWFGSAHFQQPIPATRAQLDSLFPNLDPSYVPIRSPNPKGEGVPELHDRIAYTLNGIVAALDADPSQPKALLICTHAAAMIAIGRVLTGKMPEDPDTPDFHCYTASLSRYTRRTFEIPDTASSRPKPENGNNTTPPSTAVVNWRNYGIRGYWKCEQNGYTKYLSKGAERGWVFDPLPPTTTPLELVPFSLQALAAHEQQQEPSEKPPSGAGSWKHRVIFRPMHQWSIFERFMLQFDHNPYGLPGVFYLIPMLLLLYAVSINILVLCSNIRHLFGIRHGMVNAVWAETGRTALNIVQVIFFFYPPLWGVRVVEAMLEMMEDEDPLDDEEGEGG